ncbi:MAG: LiaF transmembrane domain-containing protein [Steroidobacteraceae bacterium]
MSIQIKRTFGRRFIAGGALMITGGLLLLQQAGFLHSIDLARGWPVILIAFAILQLGSSINESRQRGWGLLLVGDWLFANTMTNWAYAQLTWPIILMGLGALMIFRAIGRRGEEQRGESAYRGGSIRRDEPANQGQYAA